MPLRISRLLPAAALLALTAPALAHYPIFLPGPAPSIDQAFVLPSARTTWHIFGALRTAGQADFIRLDNLDPSQTDSLEVDVFDKPAYAGFAPSVALIGQGLPPPAEKLPFALPAGYGALTADFTGDPAMRTVFADDAFIWLTGPSIAVPMLSGAPAYAAVWDSKGGLGEYTLSLNIDPDVSDPAFAGKFTDPIPGDGNDDGKVDIADAVIALQIAVGILPATPRRLRALDVSPPPLPRMMAGDGRITVGDALRVLQRAVGDAPDPFP